MRSQCDQQNEIDVAMPPSEEGHIDHSNQGPALTSFDPHLLRGHAYVVSIVRLVLVAAS